MANSTQFVFNMFNVSKDQELDIENFAELNRRRDTARHVEAVWKKSTRGISPVEFPRGKQSNTVSIYPTILKTILGGIRI